MHRIVSLLPSTTEIACLLGLRDRLVGVSHECDFPESVRGLPVLTAPKVDPGGNLPSLRAPVATVILADQPRMWWHPAKGATGYTCSVAPEGGGDVFHSGGRQFMSSKDPDWKAIAEWVNGATLSGPKKN